MLSATDFLPRVISTLTNFARSTLANFGSGRISRLGTSLRRGMRVLWSWFSLSRLRQLRAVLRAPLLAVLHALRVERTAHDVVAHARQILHPAAADQHHRVLLQVVTFAADVADHLEAVGQAHFGDLAQRRIRLFRRRRVDARAYPPLLRRACQGGHLRLRLLGPAPVAH